MKKILLSVSVIATILGAASCSKKDDTPATTARVMFMNACINAANPDARVNGGTVSGATNLAFLVPSGYQNIAAGTDTIAFVVSNTGTNLCSGVVSTTVSNSYSAFAAGLSNTPDFVFTQNDVTAPTSGNAKVRFVNLSADTSAHIVSYVGSTRIDTISTYKKVSSYVQVPAGSLKITAVDPANIPGSVSLDAQQFTSGKIYSIVFTGLSSGTGVAALKFTVVSDN